MMTMKTQAIVFAALCYALVIVNIYLFTIDQTWLLGAANLIAAAICFAYAIWHTVHIFDPDWMIP